MAIVSSWTLTVVVLSQLLLLPAFAAQQLVPTKTLLVKDPPSGARKVLWKVKETAATVAGDPTADGATLHIKLTPGGDQCVTMPALGWSAISTIGFKYKDADLVNGPVKVALIKKTPSGTFLVKALLKNGGPVSIAVTPGNPTASYATNFTLGVGDEYCGGTGSATPSPNDAIAFSVSNDTAPSASCIASCTATTSSTSTTTTSTLSCPTPPCEVTTTSTITTTTSTTTVALFQRVDPSFRTFASTNSSNGVDAICTTADTSCHAVDGNDTDAAHAWSSGLASSPYLQVDSGNSTWGKHIDHFTVVYSTTSCAGGNFTVYYNPAGSAVFTLVSGTFPCVAGVKTTLDIPLDADGWGLAITNNSASTNFTIYEVQFWTTN